MYEGALMVIQEYNVYNISIFFFYLESNNHLNVAAKLHGAINNSVNKSFIHMLTNKQHLQTHGCNLMNSTCWSHPNYRSQVVVPPSSDGGYVL